MGLRQQRLVFLKPPIARQVARTAQLAQVPGAAAFVSNVGVTPVTRGCFEIADKISRATEKNGSSSNLVCSPQQRKNSQVVNNECHKASNERMGRL